MFIFLTIVMGPACWFMLYALSQFWREAMSLRRRAEAKLPRSVTPVTALHFSQCHDARRAAGFDLNRGTGEHDVIVITQPLSRRSVERDVA